MNTVLYFRATEKRGRQILKRGFAKSKYGHTCRYALTDQPFAGDVTAPCDVLLRIDINLNGDLIALFERTESGSAYRTFLVPGFLLNQNGKVSEVKELEPT